MKLIRCIVQPGEVDVIVDALKSSGIGGLTVTAGGGWSSQRHTGRVVWRGREYEPRLQPEALIDVTTEDDTVDDILRTLMDALNIDGDGGDGRILVMPVELHRLRTRRIA